MAGSGKPGKVRLIDFALIEYERRGWEMPDIHVRVFDWLDRTRKEPNRVLMLWRGAAKSTTLAISNAYDYYVDPANQKLIQGADDDLAVDLSRDTLAILRAHPLTQGLIRETAGVEQWWTVEGFAASARTPQMRARGILSRTTGSRADEIQNDDVEVEKNVESPDARKKLRRKLAEQTHIIKPNGSKLFVGTPHTHDSLYEERIKDGAASFVQPLFSHSIRYEKTSSETRYKLPGPVGKDGVWVFQGIGASAQLLTEGMHYEVVRGYVVFAAPPAMVIDVCTGNAWPERFTRKEMLVRRRDCRTFGEWDSQYQLQAKPVREVRLDPDKLRLYEVEPVIEHANGTLRVMLGKARLEGFTAYWDVSLGKVTSNASALSIVFTDLAGSLYWHRALNLTGELEELGPTGDLMGGQIKQLIDACRACGIHHVAIEVNGPGGFVPAIARRHCAPHGITVEEILVTTKKNTRILDALEAPLSSGFLWAHRQVFDSGATAQMRQWDPSVKEQPDDYLDSAAGAVLMTPVRVARVVGTAAELPHWKRGTEQYEVAVDYGR